VAPLYEVRRAEPRSAVVVCRQAGRRGRLSALGAEAHQGPLCSKPLRSCHHLLSIIANVGAPAPDSFRAVRRAKLARDLRTSRASRHGTHATVSRLWGSARSARPRRRRHTRTSSRTAGAGRCAKGRDRQALLRRHRGSTSARDEHRARQALRGGMVACSNVKQKSLTIDIQHVKARG